MSLFSLYRQRFQRSRLFSKLLYLGMKLGCWPNFQKWQIYSHSAPRGLKLSLFSLDGQRFPRYGLMCNIAIFEHETWPLAKVPEVAHILSFYPGGGGSKLSLFSVYGQRFLRYMYEPIFKIAIFGFETWQVAKLLGVAHI